MEVTTDASPEARLEQMFLKERPEEPPKEEEAEELEEAEETEESDPEEGKSEETEEAADAEDSDEEVEYDGKAYKLPKELKNALLRQKDYQQKTQEIADIRRRTETQMEYLEKSNRIQSVAFEKAVELHALDKQLEQFGQIDWNSLAEQNPTDFLKFDRQYRQLAEARQTQLAELQLIAQQAEAVESETRAKQLENAQKELARRLPKLDREAKQKIADTALNTYGFTPKELDSLYDPRHVHVLHDAMKWRELQAQKPGTQKKVASAKPIQAGARSSMNQQASSDITKARESLKKSGRASDAEAYFERLFSKKRK